jgi:two-component system chemotaxis response regulator CheB
VTGKSHRIRIVVGEDSPFMQQLLVDALSSDPSIEVVGTASNGREVLRQIVDLKPDCVTLDLEMPRMNGLETLRYIMGEWPTPVVIVSAHTAEGARLTLKCLEYGAVDFVPKSDGGKSFPAEDLIEKVKAAAGIDLNKIRFAPPDELLEREQSGERAAHSDCVVLIGASTGGPQAIMDILPKLPADLPAGIVIVQHMPPNFTRFFAERLDCRTRLAVKEADEGDGISQGNVLVAPGGLQLFLDENFTQPVVMLLSRNEKHRSNCPSIDFALSSFAPVFREKLIAVIMTGMGKDGSAGSRAVKRTGGIVLCQDEETSLIFGMPGAVITEGLADEVVPLEKIAARITENVMKVQGKEKIYEDK